VSGGERPPSFRRAVPASRYGWFLGIVVVLLLGYITLNTARTGGGDARGLHRGERLPPFAAPLATSTLQGDADVAKHANSGAAGRVPACRLRGPRILNVCQLYERGPVVLTFFFTRGAHCEPTLGQLQTLSRSFPGVQLAAVAVAGDRSAAVDAIRRNRWRFPVGFDADGIVANLYKVAGCPQTTFATVGGVVRETVQGRATSAQLRSRFADVVAASRRRHWSPPAQ
jgi:hypothetical protein